MRHLKVFMLLLIASLFVSCDIGDNDLETLDEKFHNSAWDMTEHWVKDYYTLDSLGYAPAEPGQWRVYQDGTLTLYYD